MDGVWPARSAGRANARFQPQRDPAQASCRGRSGWPLASGFVEGSDGAAAQNILDPDDALKRAIAVALLEIGSDQGLPILANSLKDPTTGDADNTAVATALGNAKTPATLGVLIDSFKTGAPPLTRV